ncbi:uncharacterized protein LOC120293723 [Eucalyptus grandis]|uniref:uncharacterized protein LOC120293723 n=1 Tax=Eucalyptus grandis TaxID=71139 RepID=UPI00192EC85D|nr:uncharacterized protein LOC120293723 [Eucalyptus grandis]
MGHRDKMAPHARRCIFMGYPTLQKGYRLYAPSTGDFFVSRDVVFHEDIFPFSNATFLYEDEKSRNRQFLLEENLSSSETFIITSPPGLAGVLLGIPPPVENVIEDSIEMTPVEEPTQLRNLLEESIREESSLTQQEPARRSSWTTRPPTWTKDYICGSSRSLSTRYPILSYISFDMLSPEHLCCISRISKEQEPSSYNEANTDPRWQKAMESELHALMENHTWDIVPLPAHRKPIECTGVELSSERARGRCGSQVAAQRCSRVLVRGAGADVEAETDGDEDGLQWQWVTGIVGRRGTNGRARADTGRASSEVVVAGLGFKAALAW